MQHPADARVADLVRTRKLRVGLGLGSPALAVKEPASGQLQGPAWDLARALALRIGVEAVPIEYPRPGAVMEGLRRNAWDVTFLVISPERASEGDFSPPYMQSDFTYLVPAGSSIRSVVDADRPGVRIAVPRGDASDLRLTSILHRAELVRTDSLPGAIDLLRAKQADAYAAGRTVLLALVSQLPGSRVLTDGFGRISYAALIPKGHPERLAYVSEFIEEAKTSGLVKSAIDRAGLHGVVVSPPNGKQIERDSKISD